MDRSVFDEAHRRLSVRSKRKSVLVGIAILMCFIVFVVGMRLFNVSGASGDTFQIQHSQENEAQSEEQGNLQDTESKSVYVHISGAVNNPGLVELESGARVADAVSAAGGFTKQAASESVNLARPLEDGEQIIVATQDEYDAKASSSASPSPTQEASGYADLNAGGQTSGASLVNINSASASDLESLPGIGQATAAKIIADRQANGSFKTKEDLKRVSGIGDKKYETLADLICV